MLHCTGDDERKSGLTRCNSHDRYKCFGQCGNPSCGKNHYCDRNALEKHIAGDVDAASLICKEVSQYLARGCPCFPCFFLLFNQVVELFIGLSYARSDHNYRKVPWLDRQSRNCVK